MSGTTLSQFRTLFPASTTPSEQSAKMVHVRLKLQNIWGERTLDDLTKLVNLLGVPGTHLHLTKVNEGCIAVTWLCSTSYIRELKQAIDQAAGSLRAEGVLQVFTDEEMVLDCRHQHDQHEGTSSATLLLLVSCIEKMSHILQLENCLFTKCFRGSSQQFPAVNFKMTFTVTSYVPIMCSTHTASSSV